MAGFTKAEAQQARLKVGVYGPTGSGKTFTTLLFAEGLALHYKTRIAYVDTERGTDFYTKAVKERRVHPAAFDFDALYTKSLAEVSEAVKGLDPKVHGIIVIDSISHLWESAIDAYEGKRTSIDSIPLQAWGAIKKPYKALISVLIGCPMHVFILGRQKNLFENEDGELRKIGVAMKAEGETEYEPHLTFRMESRKSDKGEGTILLYAEKDRTGIMAGRTYPNPSFTTIAPLLSLLGDSQAPAEDEEERQAKDAELLEADKEKKAKKGEKSGSLMVKYQGEIAAAESVEALGAIAAALKKDRRYIVEDHLNTLRVLFEEKRDRIVNDQAGEV